MSNLLDVDALVLSLEEGNATRIDFSTMKKQKYSAKMKSAFDSSGAITAFFSWQQFMISGGDDKLIKGWTFAKNGKLGQTPNFTLTGHSKKVKKFSRIQNYLLSASEDKSVKVWDIKKKACIKTYNEHTKSVNTLLVIDENRFLSGSDDKSIKLWSITKDASLHTFTGHTKPVTSLAYSALSKTLVSASEDKSIYFWNFTNFTLAHSQNNAHSKSITCIRISDNNKLVSGSADSTIKVWSMTSYDCLLTIKDHGTEVFDLVLSGNFLYSASIDSINVHSFNTGNMEQTLVMTCYPSCLHLMENRTLVAVGLDTQYGAGCMKFFKSMSNALTYKDIEPVLNQMIRCNSIKYLSLEGITIPREGVDLLCDFITKSTTIFSISLANTGIPQESQETIARVWKEREHKDSHLIFNETGYTILHMAAAAGDLNELKDLFGIGMKMAQDSIGRTPKKVAELNHQAEALAFLARHQEDTHLSYLLSNSSSNVNVSQVFTERVVGLRENIKRILDEDPCDYAFLLQQTWNAIMGLRELKSEDNEVFPAGFDPHSLFPPAVFGYSGDKKKKNTKFVFVKNINHEISKLETVQKQLNLTVNKERADRLLVTLTTTYRTYREKLNQASKEQRSILRSMPVVMSGVDLPPHFVKDEPGRTLTPPIGGEKFKTHTGISDVFPIEGCHYKFNPHAPGIEFMVSSLANLIAGKGATPTELVKVIGPDGIPRTYQVSKTVIGKELQSVIQFHPNFIQKIKSENFSAMTMIGLLTDPQDGKPDNYMVEFEVDATGNLQTLEILGIDNDIAFADPIVKKFIGSEELYFMNIKNVLYFFPQMNEPLDRHYKSRFMKLVPEILILDWLQTIWKKNLDYEALLQQGVFTEQDFKGSKTRKRGLQLPIKFQVGTVAKLYQKLVLLQDKINQNSEVTHLDLLTAIEPEVSEHYRYVSHEFGGDVLKCIKSLYQEHIKSIDKIAKIMENTENEKIVINNTNSLSSCSSWSILNTAEEFGFEDFRTQTISHALREFLYYIALDRSNSCEPAKLFAAIENACFAIRQAHPIHLCTEWKLVRMVEWLLENKLVDVNLANKQLYTSLHIAAGQDNVDIAKVLIKYGANPRLRNGQSKSPKEIALGRNHSAFAEFMSQVESS